jgi:DNA-binding NtrC family response regulator
MVTFTATGPDVAMTVLDEQPIDVVLTDLRMPGNGSTLHAHVREKHPGCEVVIMTGDDGQAASAALDSGAHGFLAKPFPTLEHVILAVTRAAEHRRARRRDPRR